MKTSQILKAIVIGALADAAIFFVPFPFRFFFAFLFIFFAFRFFGYRRSWGWRGNYYSGYAMWQNSDYARRWHGMTPGQRKAFTEKMQQELFKDTDAYSGTKS